MVKGDRYDATPSLNPSLFLAHSSGLLVEPARSAGTQGLCTRRYVGVRARAGRARVFPIACSFLGLVKHNGTKWGKRVVGGVYKTYNPENQLLKPHGRPVNRLLTCLPTPAIFCFFPFSLSACLPGVQAAWRSVKATSLGAHIGPSPNDGSRSAVRAGSTTPRSIEGRCPPAPLATSGCSRATSKCHPPQMARHLPVQ